MAGNGKSRLKRGKKRRENDKGLSKLENGRKERRNSELCLMRQEKRNGRKWKEQTEGKENGRRYGEHWGKIDIDIIQEERKQ